MSRRHTPGTASTTEREERLAGRERTGPRARAAAAACLALVSAVVLAGCGSDDDSGDSGADGASAPRLSVSGGFLPQPVTGSMAAGFLLVHNSGGSADRLTSVTSELSEDVTLHSTSGGTMRERKSFAVPAHGTLDFERGGNHLMFDGLSHKPELGEKVTVTLHFATSGTVEAVLPVKETTYQPPKAGHHQ